MDLPFVFFLNKIFVILLALEIHSFYIKIQSLLWFRERRFELKDINHGNI